jgi:hypothetical protein
MPEPKAHTVDEWKSPKGVRGRLGRMSPEAGTSPYAQALVFCRARGCGAWQGRTACASPAKWVALGGAALPFLAYRAFFQEGQLVLAVLCDVHAHDLTVNMPPELLRGQEAELRTYLRRMGASGQEAAARVVTLLPLDAQVLERIASGTGGERRTL